MDEVETEEVEVEDEEEDEVDSLTEEVDEEEDEEDSLIEVEDEVDEEVLPEGLSRFLSITSSSKRVRERPKLTSFRLFLLLYPQWSPNWRNRSRSWN